MKRNLPLAQFSVRNDLSFSVSPAALDRWVPSLESAKDPEGENNVISILDVIGEDPWFGGGFSSKRLAAALRSIGNKDVFVDINSPGGNYFEGLTIYNQLRNHPAKVTVRILGVAASAASVIAMAGDEVQIARAGFLMIHNTWIAAMGDRHVLREAADWIEPFDETAIDIYAARTGLDPKSLGKLLDKETWISGKAAVEEGWADDYLEADRVKVKNAVDDRSVRALYALDSHLAKAGLTRSQRRDLVSALKGSAPGAASTAMPSAGVLAGLEALANNLEALTER